MNFDGIRFFPVTPSGTDGLRLSGLPVGSMRPPLVDPTPEQEERLAGILEAGRVLL